MSISILFQVIVFSLETMGAKAPSAEGAHLEQSWIIELKEPSIVERQLRNQERGRALENPLLLQNQLESSQNLFIGRMKNKIGEKPIQKKFKSALNAIVVGPLTTHEVKELQGMNEVLRISPNAEVRTQMQESLDLIRAPELWREFALQTKTASPSLGGRNPRLRGAGIRIGILDTGIDYLHPSLGGCLGANCKVKGGWNFISNNANVMDDHGHGTHVAGIAAGKGYAQNGTPIYGVAPDADLYSIKVLNHAGNGSFAGILAGVEWSLDPNQDGDFSDRLDVINLSLGGQTGTPDDPLARALDHLMAWGVVVVVAAGNWGPSRESILHPGNSRHAITVAASHQREPVADFSSRGPVVWRDDFGHLQTLLKPDLTAPGVLICAPRASQAISLFSHYCEDQNHIRLSGTSMATPMVAGAAALILQKNPNLHPYQVKQQLMKTSSPLQALAPTFMEQGAGFLDAYRAVFATEGPIVSLGAIKKIESEMELEIQGEFQNLQLSYLPFDSFKLGQENSFLHISSGQWHQNSDHSLRFFYPRGENFLLRLKIQTRDLKTTEIYQYFVDEYSICGREDLLKIQRRSRADYKLICDIQIDPSDPISIALLEGRFDGRFHVINYNWQNESQTTQEPLFNFIARGGLLKNLIIQELRLHAGDSTAGVALQVMGQVENVSVSGNISSSHSAAGITAYLGRQGLIRNSRFIGHIEGLVNVGGLVALADEAARIENSYVLGSLSSSQSLGGLVGESASVGLEIFDSYASVTMSSATTIGGLVGLASDPIIMSEVFWNAQSSNVNAACGNRACPGGLAQNDQSMLNPSTFEAWDFENIWAMTPFKTTPFLMWE
jgi:hypothetical protein